MTLLLMAAGRGSRYGKLKQFDDLGPKGEFLMEFSIYDAL
ncbi:MAG: UTP--glucose-1-phosphate uridylyltransferase, partial [Eudoraea sp.]|nr:UTP--glucose-1-phosphate uridylyltransferase [Eudoraea sp.]